MIYSIEWIYLLPMLFMQEEVGSALPSWRRCEEKNNRLFLPDTNEGDVPSTVSMDGTAHSSSAILFKKRTGASTSFQTGFLHTQTKIDIGKTPKDQNAASSSPVFTPLILIPAANINQKTRNEPPPIPTARTKNRSIAYCHSSLTLLILVPFVA